MTSQAIVQPAQGLEVAAQGWLPLSLPHHRTYQRSTWYSDKTTRGENSIAVQQIAKRTIDIVTAFLGLILLSPFMASIALAIVFDSPGPVLYRTYRVGKD